MKAYTLTLGEAETQLRDLVKRAQSTHRPVVLTAEESAEPMVVLLESSVFEKLRQREKQLFHLQLRRLFQHLDNVQEEWDDDTKRKKFVKAFCSSTRALWDVCPADERGLCVTLRMASRRLAPEGLTLAQVAALRGCLELLRDGAPTPAATYLCHQRLIESGLPPTMGGSASLANLYMEEL